MTKIVKWIKWAAGALIALGIIALILYQLWGKNKQKTQIDQKIEELKANDHKTEEDMAELEKLNKQSADIQKDIEGINEAYKGRLGDLEKPKPPKPGDAGKAADGFNKVW